MKFLQKKDPFLSGILHGILGAVIGLFSGLVLGLIIYMLGGAMTFLEEDFLGAYQMAPFLSMGFGSVFGALFGGIAGLKK
jgi:hypothetical protein